MNHTPDLAALRDEMRAQAATKFPQWSHTLKWSDRLDAAITSQAAELEALRKDAARYRWLRDDATTHLYVRRYEDGIAAPIDGQILDAAIDAALAGAGE